MGVIGGLLGGLLGGVIRGLLRGILGGLLGSYWGGYWRGGGVNWGGFDLQADGAGGAVEAARPFVPFGTKVTLRASGTRSPICALYGGGGKRGGYGGVRGQKGGYGGDMG